MMDKKNLKEHHMSTTSKALLGVAITAAVGTAVGMIFAPKKMEDLKDEAVKKAKVLAKNFKKTRKDIQNSVKDIFGEVNDELEVLYLKLQGYMMAALHEVKESASLDKYKKIAKEAIAEFADEHDFDKSTLNKLAKHLEADFEDMRAKMKEQMEKDQSK